MKWRLWISALIAAVVLQTVVLLGLWGYSRYPLWVGQDVNLAVRPMDPRDWFRGQYLRLDYDIDTLPIPQAGVPRVGRRVYVVLIKRGPVWRAGKVLYTPPADKLYLAGRIRSINFDDIRVRYGIEAWFVPADQARELSRQLRNGGVAEVRIAPGGRAALVAVRPAEAAREPDKNHDTSPAR